MSTIDISAPTGDQEIRLFGDILAESLCFPPPDEFDLAAVEGRENLLVARIDGCVVGGLIVRPMGQWFGGRCVPMGAVRGVATSPEYRGQGIGQAMMCHALNEMHDAGTAISVLYPATQPVYRRPGFEQAGVSLLYRIDPQAFGVHEQPLAIRKMTPDDYEAVHNVYTERARHESGQVDRDAWLWKRKIEPRIGKAFGYVVSRGDEMEGYVVFTKMHREAPFYDLYVNDMVALTVDAGRSLLSFLANHRSMSKRITWTGPPSDPLMLLTPEQNENKVERLAWMLRIVDVDRALEARGYAPHIDCQVHFEVRDDVLPHNNDRFVLEIADGQARVRRGGEGRLAIDVRGLASLYTGYLSPEQLKVSGYADGDAESMRVAASVFAGPAPWLADMF